MKLGAGRRARPRVGAIVVGVATVGLAVLYEPVMRELVRLWLEEPEYSYGAVVAVLTACLLWVRRRALRGRAHRERAWRHGHPREQRQHDDLRHGRSLPGG